MESWFEPSKREFEPAPHKDYLGHESNDARQLVSLFKISLVATLRHARLWKCQNRGFQVKAKS